MSNNWIIVSRFLQDEANEDGTPSMGYYTRIDKDNGVYHEIYDPRQATVFHNKARAEQWIKDNCIYAKNMKLEQREPHIKLFEQFLEGGMIRRTFDMATTIPHNYEYDPEKHTWMDVLEWTWMNLLNPDAIPFEVYKTWPKIYSLDELTFIWDFTSSHDIRVYSKKYYNVELVFPKGETNYKQFKLELDYMMVNFDLTPNDDGTLPFKVFDRFLCEGGNSVTLVKHPDGKWSVEGRYCLKLAPTTLKKCFDYLVRERYYG